MFQEGLSPKPAGTLDQIKSAGGPDRLKAFFQDQIKLSMKTAVNLLNDNHLRFSTLFLLEPQIRKWSIFPYLNSRNQSALDVIHRIQTKKLSESGYFNPESKQKIYPVLKWILETGWIDDGLNNQYDDVLDKTSILLIKIYKDYSALPCLVEMVFNRFRKGFFIYDLVWALFESRNHQCLPLIASHMHSTESKDMELVQKLLGFIPCMCMDRSMPQQKYQHFLRWYEDNRLFLYYTGESFQQTHNPQPFAVSLEAKYLCRPLTKVTDKSPGTIRNEEYALLDQFKKQPPQTQEFLSNFSYFLYRQSRPQWYQWLQMPVTKQLQTAMGQKGGLP
ncbi:MAG: hypothetical protein N2645_14635 [Clostridia bacterium]|nr:hypothetical protein [Clostridia bacterium]